MSETKEEVAKSFANKIINLMNLADRLGIVIDVQTVPFKPLAMGNTGKYLTYRDKRNNQYPDQHVIDGIVYELKKHIKYCSFISWGTSGEYLAQLFVEKGQLVPMEGEPLENYGYRNILISGEQYRYIQKQLSDHYNPKDDQ